MKASTPIEGIISLDFLHITDEWIDKFMVIGGPIEEHSTFQLTIDVNMGNWSPPKVAFYKEFISNVTVQGVARVRGTIFDDCFPIPPHLMSYDNHRILTEINHLEMFSKFKMEITPTPSIDNKLMIITTSDVPNYAEVGHQLNLESLELLHKKIFSKGIKLLQNVQDAFGDVIIKLEHEHGHKVHLMPDELEIIIQTPEQVNISIN